jgi:ATP-dependent Clp protease ATP-binding subunit ClpA
LRIQTRDQNYVAIEHILHAVANEEDELFTSTMRDLAVDPRSVKLLIEKRMDGGASIRHGLQDRSRDDRAFQAGDGPRAFAGRRVIDGSDIFYVFQRRSKHIDDVLQNLGVPSDELRKRRYANSQAER